MGIRLGVGRDVVGVFVRKLKLSYSHDMYISEEVCKYFRTKD